MKKGFSSRTKARRRAVDVLFEADQRGFGTNAEKLRRLADERRTVSTAQTGIPPYAHEIVYGVAKNGARIDDAIAACATNWTLERMPGVDLAILRVGAWEILYNSEIDTPVAIKQALLIAEVIGGDKSPGFINAVLDRLAKNERIRQEAVKLGVGVPEPLKVSQTPDEAKAFGEDTQVVFAEDETSE
ncbi:MAG: transcription antitermination factor NusB [Actinomycetaceae bacterium]|nr:transcription antitermination factor NusB [Actinomycetaceae bacterium]